MSSMTANKTWRWLVVLAVILAMSLGIAQPWNSHAADLKIIRYKRMGTIKADLATKGLELGQPILIRIFKESDELELWIRSGAEYRLYKTFPICAWSGRLGPKLKEGDGQAPEGFYTVGPDQMKPDSQYHLAFNLGYPNAYDKANNRTGSFLMVHGNCVSIGCYAMTNKGIEEMWLIADEALKGGQAKFQVHSFPFRLTQENLARYKSSQWINFWRTLKLGYDKFEKSRIDLNISIKDKTYVIGSR